MVEVITCNSVVLGGRLAIDIRGKHAVGRSHLTHSKGVFRFQSYYRLDKAFANTNTKSFVKGHRTSRWQISGKNSFHTQAKVLTI